MSQVDDATVHATSLKCNDALKQAATNEEKKIAIAFYCWKYKRYFKLISSISKNIVDRFTLHTGNIIFFFN